MYSLFFRIFNILILPFRFIRCCYHNELKKTNCNLYLVSDTNPKSILTWNIQSMCFFTNNRRVKNIIKYLKNFNCDILCLQEVFEDNVKLKLINQLSDIYPYYLLGKTKKKYIIGEDSGLLILSKYNINFIKEIEFSGNVCPDIMAQKTMLYFSVGNFNFSTAHIHSNNKIISEKHIKKSLYMSPFNEYILLGDLNNCEAENIVSINKNNNIPTCKNEILDYILPIGYKNKHFDISVIKINLKDVTDHLPIKCIINNSEKIY